MIIGVLAFQGAFAKHVEKLHRLECETKLVLTHEDLFCCDGLIIPGGESTVMRHHLHLSSLTDSLIRFAKERPLFGTCAGLILMTHYNLLSISVERNAYGRQIDSFVAQVSVTLGQQKKTIPAPFIRAPKITQIHASNVEVLAYHHQTPILVKQGHCLGAAFHPELTNDLSIHQYYLNEVQHAKSRKERSFLSH